jgi:Ribonuclease G/E
VQVTGLPEAGKAVPVTQRILLKARSLILTPGASGLNLSRSIKHEDERLRLHDLVTASVNACLGAKAEAFLEDNGLIIRTGAVGTPDLSEELAALLKEWQGLEKQSEPGAPVCGGAWRHALSEWAGQPLDQVILPSTDTAPQNLPPAPVLQEKTPFESAGIWDAINTLRNPEATLSTGSIAIEPTRALVAVDVNTGGEFTAGSALKTNLAAMSDLPRQLRLRGLGGQIVVDFAPLKKAERKQIEKAAHTALRACPVETSLVGWTPLGHLEMTRKRERRPLSEVL